MSDDEPPLRDEPPIGGSWGRLYALLVGFLAAQVIVYWLITRFYG